MGAALTALGVGGGAVAVNLHSYERLTHERSVMEIRFVETAPRQYTALLYPEDSDRVHRYELLGDEWQLDARIIKWTGPAVITGMDSIYRLERLSGRYRDVESERSLERSVHDLANGGGLDLWEVARDHSRWLPWLDSLYGNATYLPMSNEARYQVVVNQSGVLARPVNDPAREAVRHWR